MILAHEDIQETHKQGDIFIDPFNPERLNPNSYDVSLGNWFVWLLRYEHGLPVYSDIWSMAEGECVKVPQGGMLLAITRERIGARGKLTAEIRAKSSIERGGIHIAQSAGLGDVGYYDQHWTVAVTSSVGGAVLKIGQPFAQVVFHETKTATAYPYTGQYAKDDWPFAMLPMPQRNHYRYLTYGQDGRINIANDDRPVDNSWRNLIVR